MTSTDHTIRALMITSEWPTPGRPRTTHFIKRQAEFLRAAGVHVDVFQFKAGKRPWNYLAAWVRLRRRLARTRYDLVHAQFGQSGLPALPKRLPLVVTFRGDDLEGIVGEDLRVTVAGRLLQFASRGVARCADACIVVSEHMKQFLPRSVPAHVIPSGLDLDLFRDSAHSKLVKLIHSADRLPLLAALEDAAGSRGRPVDVLLEVNTSGEASKNGAVQIPRTVALSASR